MTPGGAQGSASDRIGKTTGDMLAKVYQPDRAADDTLDRLIDQLDQVPWARRQQSKQ